MLAFTVVSGPILIGDNFGVVGRAWELESGQLCPSLACSLCGFGHSLSFGFLICIIRVMIPVAQGFCEDEMKKI